MFKAYARQLLVNLLLFPFKMLHHIIHGEQATDGEADDPENLAHMVKTLKSKVAKQTRIISYLIEENGRLIEEKGQLTKKIARLKKKRR